MDQDKLSCKIREYIDGGNLPRNIDEAVAVKVADNGGWAIIRELWFRHNGCMDWNGLQKKVYGSGELEKNRTADEISVVQK